MTYILQAVAIMLEWLRQHKDNPYPNDDEKAMLIKQTGLTINQINYWFTNARRRILPKWAQQCKWGCSLPPIAQMSSFQPGNSYISPNSAWGYGPRGVTLTASGKLVSSEGADRDTHQHLGEESSLDMSELNVFIVHDSCWLVLCIQISFGIVVISWCLT